MKKKIVFFYSAFLILNSTFSFGQAPAIEWQKNLGGNGSDKLFSLAQTNDGGYIFGGHSFSGISGNKTEASQGQSDYWIVKTDSVGNIQWQKTIGGSSYDYLTAIQQTSDGGFILGGGSESNISGDKSENCMGQSDFWVVKTDSAGNIQWQNTIGGSDDDWITSLQQTIDGGYILGGHSYSNISGDKTENSLGMGDYWIVKIDSAGNIQWQNTIGGNYEDILHTISQTSDGDYILGGTSESSISGDKIENNNGFQDYWIVRTDSAGNIKWQKDIGADDDDALYSMHQTSDDGYILAGTSYSNISGDKTENSNGDADYWIVKIDSSGIIQWQNTIGGDATDGLRDLSPTTDGGYIMAGYSGSDISGDKTESYNGDSDYWIVKIDATGNIQWQNTIGGNYEDIPAYIKQTVDGGFVCGGYSNSDISGDKTESCFGGFDYWVVKLYPDTTTGISDVRFENSDLRIFPNPAKHEITIAGYTLQNNQPAMLKIYDVMGKEVLSQSLINSTSQIVDLKSFTSDVYFLQLQTGAKVSRVKFVKQ